MAFEKNFKNKFNVQKYIDQFNILGIDETINCEGVCSILYEALLNKFKIKISEDEYFYFSEYQERLYDFVGNLRENDFTIILIVFDYLLIINEYLVDIVIMMWCLPRINSYSSQQFYVANYKENIAKFNFKLVNCIKNDFMKYFCMETLSKTNNVPIHCIDYLWYYMDCLCLDVHFLDDRNKNYVEFSIHENEDTQSINFGFNMEYVLELNLGNISKNSLRKYIKKLITNVDVVETLKTNKNYWKQIKNIYSDPKKYFKNLPIQVKKIVDSN